MDQKSLPSLARSSNIAVFTDGISAALLKRSHCNDMAKRSANNGRSSLADEVLQYLINHDRAHDTVEGIVAWWLPIQRIEYAINNVEAALRELVARELVIARKTSDGRIHYRMNPKKKQAIRHRLKAKTGGATISARLPSKARRHN